MMKTTLILLLLTSCVVYKKRQLTYYGKNNPSLLRLDGYYYSNVVMKNHENSIMGFYLFSNGCVYGSYNSITTHETIRKLENNPNNKSAWGVYLIKKDSIFFQRFEARPGLFLGAWIVVEDKGKILNDTTFIFHTGKIYHFKHNIKPDSTNWMMSDKTMQKIARKNHN